MKTTPVLLVGLDPVAQAAASKVVRTAFPGAVLTMVPNADEAVQAAAIGGPEIIMVGHDKPEELAKASAALDEQALPRWAVVIFGGTAPTSDGITVLRESASTEQQAESLQVALTLFRLRRENARLRGDLQTVATRVNHDLRTPLSPIFTSCEVLKITLGDDVAQHLPVIHSITNSVDELTHLIDRVSFVLKASVLPKPREQIQMTDVVFGVLGRLESRILATKATIQQPKTWPQVTAVATWVEAIWMHLVANALQHTGPMPKMELGYDESTTEFRFWIRNEGREIPPERRGKLFQPFHQLYQTNASRGLGLSIVRRLTDLQGGHCGYEPLGAQGSRFFFTLPKA